MLNCSTSLATLFGRSACPLFLAAVLVVAPGVATATDFYVDVDTTETNGAVGGGNEPVADGDTLTVNEGVTMTIDEDGAGLIVDGSSLAAGFIFDVVVTNNGSIYTTGTSDNCGVNGYQNTTPTDPCYDTTGLSTNLSAARSFGYGDAIYVDYATNAMVINNGLLDVGDAFGSGIALYRSDNSMSINNGVIDLRNDSTYGLFTTRSDAATLVNNGSIYSYSVSSSKGMRLAAFDRTAASFSQADFAKTGHLMVNNGLIQAWKSSTNTGIMGMELDGAWEEPSATTADEDVYTYIVDSAMYNYGTIRSIAIKPAGIAGVYNDFFGMHTRAHNVDLYNYGTIDLETAGTGIDVVGSGARVYNYGTINVDGRNASPGLRSSIGMYVFLDRTVLNYDDGGVTDIYRTDGTEEDYRNKIVNAGLIQVNNQRGSFGVGVHIAGDSGQDFYNYGTIISPNGWSLLLDADKDQGTGVHFMNNVYLFDGSILVGDINVNPASRDQWSIHLGDGYNAALRFDDADNINWYNNRGALGGPLPGYFYAPNGYIVVDNVLFTFDLESYSQQDQATWSMVSMIQDAVDDETQTRPAEGDFAFSGDSDGGPSNKWARMFAGWVHDPGDGAVAVGDDASEEREGGFNGYSAGTIVGVNKTDRSYYIGAAYSQVSSIEEMDNDTGYETYSGTLFGGIATTLRDRFNLSLTTGVSFNHTERDLNDTRVAAGIDTVTANYASVFLSPSLLVEGPWGSSLRLNYLGGWTQAHSYELSGGEELEVAFRFNQVAGAKFQMAHDIPKISETFPIRVRYGVEGSYANGRDIDSKVTLAGYNTPWLGTGLSTPYDDGFTAGGFAALDIGPATFQAGYDTEEQVSVRAGLKVRF